jgi:DNA-directed RNA polymerase subunit N (RpoN/RPB10)
MSAEPTINGWPLRAGLKYLRCFACGRSIPHLSGDMFLEFVEEDNEWLVAQYSCLVKIIPSDEELVEMSKRAAKITKECRYRYDLERKGMRKGITMDDFKDFLISAVMSELREIDFENKFRGEDEQDFNLKVSVMKISKEEQKQYLDRKIVKDAEERMGMLLKAKRI